MTLTVGSTLGIAGATLVVFRRALSPTTMGWAPGSWDQTNTAYWMHTWACIGSGLLVGGLIIAGLGLHAWSMTANEAKPQP